MNAGENGNSGHEERDVSVGGVVKVGIAFLTAMLVVLFITLAIQFAFTGRAPDLSPHPPSLADKSGVTLPPEPRLQSDPADELKAFRAREDALLNSYGWVDPKAGIVHIPIQRAMDLILQRGLPVRSGDAAQEFKDQGQERPGSSSSGRMMEKVTP